MGQYVGLFVVVVVGVVVAVWLLPPTGSFELKSAK